MKINRLFVAAVLVATSAALTALLAGTGALSGDKDAATKAAPAAQVDVAAVLVIYFNEVDKGGHFAAWEQPELFSREVAAAFRPLRQP